MKLAARILAPIATTTAVTMAAIAAWDRGGTMIDRAMLVALSVVICAGAHLLPAISRRPASWLLWLGCLLGALYGHLTFFTHASVRAGDERAHASRQVAGVAQQILAARDALAGIEARPLATVAAELSLAQPARMRAALQTELAEAKRAAKLRDGLVGLADDAAAAEVTSATDPVIARLSAVTGSSAQAISLAVALGFAVLLELMGALLWYEALQPVRDDAQDSTPDADQLDALREAVGAGLCRPTVAGIRVFLGCGQARALALRRALAAA